MESGGGLAFFLIARTLVAVGVASLVGVAQTPKHSLECGMGER
jgi:hypothetical protein